LKILVNGYIWFCNLGFSKFKVKVRSTPADIHRILHLHCCNLNLRNLIFIILSSQSPPETSSCRSIPADPLPMNSINYTWTVQDSCRISVASWTVGNNRKNRFSFKNKHTAPQQFTHKHAHPNANFITQYYYNPMMITSSCLDQTPHLQLLLS
jgi:hypothetical protein